MIIHQYDETPCPGMNCGSTDGKHSKECIAEHTAAAAAGDFVKWLPIEGAPKDRELLLVDEDGARTVGRWGKHNHVPLYGWIRDVELYGEEVDGFDPTHYQLLSAPPVPNK